MEDMVIFSSLPMCMVIGLIIALHVAGAILSQLGSQGRSVKLIVWILVGINAVAHFAVIFYALYSKAEAEEMLLFGMLSSAVAMTAIGLKEKVSRGGKK